jgi:hypothetical protein
MRSRAVTSLSLAGPSAPSEWGVSSIRRARRLGRSLMMLLSCRAAWITAQSFSKLWGLPARLVVALTSKTSASNSFSFTLAASTTIGPHAGRAGITDALLLVMVWVVLRASLRRRLTSFLC